MNTAPSAGVVIVTVGGVTSGGAVTRYVAVAPPGFPATSVAFTVNVWVPSEVSIGSPSATGPAQVARPEPPASSAQS